MSIYDLFLFFVVIVGLVVLICVSILVYKKSKITKYKKLQEQKEKAQLEAISFDKEQREFDSFYNTLEQMKKDPASAFKSLQETGLVDSDGQVTWRS